MKPSQLDHQSEQALQASLFNKEEIIWEGSPDYRVNWYALFVETIFGIFTWPFASFLSFGFSSLGLAMLIFSIAGIWLGFFICLAVFGIGLFLIFYFTLQIRINTRYAYTKNRLYFRLWNLFNVREYYIDYQQVGRVTYEEYGNGVGVLHILLKGAAPFKTRDLRNFKKRHHPTFEKIPEVVLVQQQLSALLKQSHNKA